MYKLIDSSSFFSFEEPQVTVLDLNASQGLVKAAADSRISEYVSQIDPKQGKIYLHIVAMGAGEYYGANRNADYFPEEALLAHHKTFETGPAYVYRNHVNKNPAIAIGKVVFSIYNERMHRVELIAEVDTELGKDIENRVAKGDYPATSMACKTPYDVCSICHNKAHTRQEYCGHLRNELGRLYPDGRRVMALNVAPLKFFDISIVIRPADVTSSILQKVAFAEGAIGSAELAEEAQISDETITKTAAFRKVSEIIKEIEEGYVTGVDKNLNNIISKLQDPDPITISKLVGADLETILTTMAHLGINPSVEYLGELIGQKFLGSEYVGIGALVRHAIHCSEPEDRVPAVGFSGTKAFDPTIAKILAGSIDYSSLLPRYVEKRAAMKKMAEIGYASFNWQSYTPPINGHTPEEYDHFKNALVPITKTLLTIGGVVLLAKMFISRLIDKQIKDKIGQEQHLKSAQIKIELANTCSDYQLASMLSKYATAHETRKQPEDVARNNLVGASKFLLKKTQTPTGNKLANLLKYLHMTNKMINNQ